MIIDNKKTSPYFTWGCADELTFRLKKTLYCNDEKECYDLSSVALTDVAVSTLLELSTCHKRPLTQRYASSINRQLPLSPCALMIGILYCERLHQMNPYYFGRVSTADLYVISLLVATKFLHDEGEEEEIFNEEWAVASGLAVTTVNRLEREFLDAIDWSVYVNPDQFLRFCTKMETKIALKYGLQRGWFSYTDLSQVFVATQYQQLVKGIVESTIKIIGGCALIYSMSLSILATAFICYSAPTSSRALSSQNLSSTISQPTTQSDAYFPQRFTRKRKLLPSDGVDNDEEGIKVDFSSMPHEREVQVIVGRNTPNTTLLSVGRDAPQHCICNHSSPSCFESNVQHHIYQTKLFLTNDPLHSRYFCMKQLFELDPGKQCKCQIGVKSTFFTREPDKMIAYQSSHQVYFGRKYNSHQILMNPVLFGKVIM